MGVNGVMQMLGSSRQQGASGNGASALAQGGRGHPPKTTGQTGRATRTTSTGNGAPPMDFDDDIPLYGARVWHGTTNYSCHVILTTGRYAPLFLSGGSVSEKS